MHQWKNSPEQKKGTDMEVIVLGDGGHSKVIQDMIRTKMENRIIAILDDKYEYAHDEHGMTYAPVAYLNQIITTDTKVVIAIGNNDTRKQLAKKLAVETEQYLTVVHPSAVISPSATIGYGTVVMPGVYINADAIIGNHCIINTGAVIEHDVQIGDFAHISPNATLTGNVSVSEGVHIGSGATIIPQIEIGSWSLIGAGSTVIKHIPNFCTAVGCPTQIVKKQAQENIEVRK